MIGVTSSLQWELRMGLLSGESVRFTAKSVQPVRELPLDDRPFCSGCADEWDWISTKWPFYSAVPWIYTHRGSFSVGVNCLNSFKGLEFGCLRFSPGKRWAHIFKLHDFICQTHSHPMAPPVFRFLALLFKDIETSFYPLYRILL